MYCHQCGASLPEDAKFCEACGARKEQDAHEQAEASPKDEVAVAYYSISPGRLWLFSVLTFNLYEVYWFAKNWEAIRKATGKKISPFWRAVLCVFFCYDFFLRVSKSVKDDGYDKSYSPGWLATAYIILLFAGNAYSKSSAQGIGVDQGTYWLLFFALVVLTPLPLLATQRAINFHNAKTIPNHAPTTTFTAAEVALIVVGILLMGLVLLGILTNASS